MHNTFTKDRPWQNTQKMRRKFQFVPGEFYHIYNRGNNKMPIFLKDKDHERLIKLLFLCNSLKPVVIKDLPQGRALGKIDRGKTIVDIGAYCLMPNHFHLLIHECMEGGISKFMLKLATAYSMYFNMKHKRTGTLFEGRFKARHANDDRYLKYLFAYIHLNPVKLIDSQWKENGIIDRAKAQRYLKTYRFSSYLDYLGKKRPENMILNKDVFPEYFENFSEFKDFIDEWLTAPAEYQSLRAGLGKPLC